MSRRTSGFTLIELLVVIAIIAIFSTVVTAALNAARAKGRDAQRISSIKQVQLALELYANDHGGLYPSTGGMSMVYVDPGCKQTITGTGDLKTADWVPNLAPTYMSRLPVDPKPLVGGCYMYSSNGTKYILSAYGTSEVGSNGGVLDSDFGFREMNFMDDPACYYSTNYPSIDAIHRKSFTMTNLTTSDFSICAKIGP